MRVMFSKKLQNEEEEEEAREREKAGCRKVKCRGEMRGKRKRRI